LTVNWNRQNFSGEDPEQHPAVAALRKNPATPVKEVAIFRGEVTAVISPEHSIEALTLLRDDPALAFDLLADVTAVHWPERKGAEFDVVYQLYSHGTRMRIRVKVPLADGQEVRSAVPLWATADWLEREVYDMFGIPFAGHPDQRRIVNPPNFEGHPLRKEFPVQGRVRW